MKLKIKSKKSNKENFDFLEMGQEIKPKQSAIKVASIYAVCGLIWITIGSKILGIGTDSIQYLINMEIVKGGIFILITAVTLFFVLYRHLLLLEQVSNKRYESYVEMAASHEELIMAEEELRQQFEEIQKHRDALLLSEERYALAVAGANDGIWEWDLEKDRYFFSLQQKPAFNYEVGDLELKLETWIGLLHPDDQQDAKQRLDNYIKSKEKVYEGMYRLKTKDGNYRWVLSRGQAIRNQEGRVIRMAGSHTDITNYIQLQNYLEQETKFSEEVLNHASVIIFVWSQDGKIIRYNTFAERLLGYSKKEVLGCNWIDIIIPEGDRKRIQDHLINPLSKGKLVSKNENKVQCKDGKCLDIFWHNSFLKDSAGNILYIISIGEDITNRKEMERQVRRLAYYDSLTQLPNRTSFEKYIKRNIQIRSDTKTPFAILYLDIDNFKHINDTLGHEAGDQLLIHIGKIFRNYMDSTDFVARMGGDEFVIIVSYIPNEEYIIQKVEQILMLLRKPFEIQGFEFFASGSIGIALYPKHGEDIGTLLKSADTAMFAAKDAGKNTYSFYTEKMKEDTLHKIQMLHQLRSAIQNEELMLYYQPQVNLSTGEIMGVEALIRWKHPEKGFISPQEFIPLAEETGDILAIGKWVFEVAYLQKKTWEIQGYKPILMSINLSAKQLMQKDLVCSIKELVNRLQIPFKELQLEITETAVIGDVKAVIQILQQIRELGITVALDDFGTGYSSLTYLKQLPIDVLKIDRSFVSNINMCGEEEVIVNSVIQIAHDLDLVVVAEGIETEEQLAFLREYHCDIGQGYFFSRPLPPEEIEKQFSKTHQ
ncbi:MAG: EAL domain-containing protein [Epulopiscium sp.]|nr:EAL domain-containing protein [Candidatus Epulonipiscium sp.]